MSLYAWKRCPGTHGRRKMIVTNKGIGKNFTCELFWFAPRFLTLLFTPAVMVSSITYVSPLIICCRVDRLKIKQQITDVHIVQTLKYHPLLWQSCPGIDQSVGCRAPARCRLKILLWDSVDHCHAIWSSETSPLRSTKPDQPKKEWKHPKEIWLLLDGVTSSSADLRSHKTLNNLLMQIWNLFFCWRSWCAISKLYLKNSFWFCVFVIVLKVTEALIQWL